MIFTASSWILIVSLCSKIAIPVAKEAYMRISISILKKEVSVRARESGEKPET